MTSGQDGHPRKTALGPGELRCNECGTVVPGGAETCDECASADLAPVDSLDARLVAHDEDRAIVFLLRREGPNVIGRREPGSSAPEVDLQRFPASTTVHRRHASIEYVDGVWHLSHLGTNPVLIRRGDETIGIAPGTTLPIVTDDWIVVGSIALHFAVA